MDSRNEMEKALENMESHPAFLEKSRAEEETTAPVSDTAVKSRERLHGWQRKRQFRKKMVRKFLSLNPSLKINELERCDTNNLDAIYFGDTQRTYYVLNPYTKVYISPRGDLRQYNGVVSRSPGVGDCLYHKPDRLSSYTNHCLRHLPLTEDMALSGNFYRKLFGRTLADWNGW